MKITLEKADCRCTLAAGCQSTKILEAGMNTNPRERERGGVERTEASKR